MTFRWCAYQCEIIGLGHHKVTNNPPPAQHQVIDTPATLTYVKRHFARNSLGGAVAMERSERYGAFSSLGLTINGLLTALLTPFVLQAMGV